MELRSDIEFKSSDWAEINDKLKGVFFETLWDAFKLCVSIGIMYDTRLEDEESGADKPTATIPRNMFNRYSEDISYFFKTAILTTNSVDLSEKDRLYLAFSEDVNVEELEGEDEETLKEGVSDSALSFDKARFLKEYANFGAQKIASCVTQNTSETMENIMTFLDDSYHRRTDELIAMSKIEEIVDETD